jgi:hypothetical protein
MKLSKQLKSLYSLFKYISVVFCSAMFFYLMIDVWDKFNNQMTNMGVRFTGEDVKEKLLPCLTACPWNAFRKRGFFFEQDDFIKQTYKREEIFFDVPFVDLYNISLFSIKEIHSIFQGRCYMVCHLRPLPIMIPFHIFFQKYRDIKGISNSFLCTKL